MSKEFFEQQEEEPKIIIGNAKLCIEQDCFCKQGKFIEIIPKDGLPNTTKSALEPYKKVLLCAKKGCCLIHSYEFKDKPKKKKVYKQKKIDLDFL